MALSGITTTSAVAQTSLPLIQTPEIKIEPSSQDQRPAIPEQSQAKPLTKLLPLLPKPPPPPLSTKHILSTKKLNVTIRSKGHCRVKLCPLQHCRLRSHRDYIGSRTIRVNRGSKHGQDSEEGTPRSSDRDVVSHKQYSSRLTILRGGVDGLPALPLDGLENPVFRTLFHQFFDYQFDRIARIVFPPPITEAEKVMAAKRKGSAMAVALSAPVYCLHYIAAAHHQVAFRRDYTCTDQVTTLLHGKVTELLRAKLDNFVKTEIQDIVLVIFTLVMFEIAAGRTKSLLFHRNAVHHLIKSHGGVHNMDRAVPIILTLDRILSIFTCMPPVYSPPPNQFIRKPTSVPVTYGTYFDDVSSKSLLSSEVSQYCIDACRTIEILESEGWTFDPWDPPFHDSPNLHYFFFLRDCVVNEFVRLNVKLADQQTISRCVLLTAKIVEYATLMDNYLVTLPLELANKVRGVICGNGKHLDWKSCQPILVWILFILACVSDLWDGRSWTVELLREQLELKYCGCDWPPNWRQHELDNVRRFVWSDQKFCTKFAKVCNDLQYANIEHVKDG